MGTASYQPGFITKMLWKHIGYNNSELFLRCIIFNNRYASKLTYPFRRPILLMEEFI